jgi:hypothetical protein
MSLGQSYASALAAAKTCDPSINMPQCLYLVAGSIDGCSCQTYVNKADPLKTLQGQWQDLGCPPSPCPPITCPALTGATCEKNLLCKDVS